MSVTMVGSVKHGLEVELPPSKRLRECEPPSWQETILGKFGLPMGSELRAKLTEQGPAILEKFRSIEMMKPATLHMLLTDPAAVYKSVQVLEIVPRTLGIFRLGQQSPDWYDRFRDVVGEAGKFSAYDVLYEGTLARDSYMRIYKALEKAIAEPEVEIEHLAKLLFYVDSFVTAESERPSYQALTAVALFTMQEFIRKAGGDPAILGLKDQDTLFSYSDCDILKWPDKRLLEISDKLYSLEAPQPLKDEIKTASTLY